MVQLFPKSRQFLRLSQPSGGLRINGPAKRIPPGQLLTYFHLHTDLVPNFYYGAEALCSLSAGRDLN